MGIVLPMSTNTYRDDELVSIGAAASVLGVSVSTVRRWDSLGHLRSTRTVGGQRRYRVADLLALRDRAA
jgi:excisionase family DNA binding protein